MGEYVPHDPVLVRDLLELLALRQGAVVVDCTAGSGSATEAMLSRVLPGGAVVAIDRDPEAVAHCRARLAQYGPSAQVLHTDFRELTQILPEAGYPLVDAVVMDLGMSSHQLDAPGRGFAFRRDEELDMRMDPTRGESARELLARADERELSQILRDLGEERHHRRVAAAICRARQAAPITRTAQLARIVSDAVPAGSKTKIHPATKSFMALRIALNDELGALSESLPAATGALRPGGRLAVISYHSLEDRIVKQYMRTEAKGCVCPPRQPLCTCGKRPTLRELTRRPVRPSAAEVGLNPRARSARLRVAERLPEEEAD